MEVLFERVAGLDIGKASLTVYMRTPGPNGRRTLQSGFGRVITPDRRREHRRRDREPTGRGGIRAPTLIGFHCLVCGLARPAEAPRGRRPLPGRPRLHRSRRAGAAVGGRGRPRRTTTGQ